jgi:hypothetical protein
MQQTTEQLRLMRVDAAVPQQVVALPAALLTFIPPTLLAKHLWLHFHNTFLDPLLARLTHLVRVQPCISVHLCIQGLGDAACFYASVLHTVIHLVRVLPAQDQPLAGAAIIRQDQQGSKLSLACN